MDYARGSATWIGLNGPVFERQICLATSLREREASRFVDTLTGAELVAARVEQVRDLKNKREMQSGLSAVLGVWRLVKGREIEASSNIRLVT